MKIIRYRRNLRRLPRYVMSTKQIPVSHRRLFLGRGSAGRRNTQRLQDTLRPEVARYLQPNRFWGASARNDDRAPSARLGKLLSADTPLNPVRPLPPVGGNPALHGIEPDEKTSLALGSALAIRWCTAPRASGRPGWQSCWSPRISGGMKSPSCLIRKATQT